MVTAVLQAYFDISHTRITVPHTRALQYISRTRAFQCQKHVHEGTYGPVMTLWIITAMLSASRLSYLCRFWISCLTRISPPLLLRSELENYNLAINGALRWQAVQE